MKRWASTFVLAVLSVSSLRAATDTEAALSLLESPSARPAALGEALTAATDDATAFIYNPSALATLESGHAAFLYHHGVSGDAYGQFLIGKPFEKNSAGLSVGYYDGGTIEIEEDGVVQTLTAQKDVVVGLGVARSLGAIKAGVTGKYFSSELAERDKATAYALDLGANYYVGRGIHLGAAVQNLGTELEFNGVGSDLPRIARLGMAMNLPFAYQTILFLDAPYYLNQSQIYPAAGLETGFGPLSFRVGYRKLESDNEISLGAGFLVAKTELSYSFQLNSQADSQQRISVDYRFGEGEKPVVEEKQPAQPEAPYILDNPEKNAPWWKSESLAE